LPVPLFASKAPLPGQRARVPAPKARVSGTAPRGCAPVTLAFAGHAEF